jgi:hypothetical protein
MKRFLTIASLMFICHAVAGVQTASGQAPATIAITADVLSFENQSRIMVIRGPDGARRRVMLDDVVGGFGSLKAGDRVVLTVREEPGMARASSLFKSNVPRRSTELRTSALPTSGLQADLETTDTTATPPPNGEFDLSTRSLFSQQVSALAARANAIDLLWGQFRTACDVRTSSRYDDAREWFGLWDGRVAADLSSGFCRDMFNEIVDAGASINASMAAAEESADEVLLPGTMRDIRRRYAMDWEGWSLARPERVER